MPTALINTLRCLSIRGCPFTATLSVLKKINHLLVYDTNQLIKELEPIKNQPQHLIEYAKRVAELVKKI